MSYQQRFIDKSPSDFDCFLFLTFLNYTNAPLRVGSFQEQEKEQEKEQGQACGVAAWERNNCLREMIDGDGKTKPPTR